MSQVLIKSGAQAFGLANFINDHCVNAEDEDGVLLTQQGDDVYVSGHLFSAVIEPSGEAVE